jgi:hypothetical protein
VRRQAKVLLLSGCAIVLALELPGALACLAAGWNGPYAEPAPSSLSVASLSVASTSVASTAAPRTLPAGAIGCIELARR